MKERDYRVWEGARIERMDRRRPIESGVFGSPCKAVEQGVIQPGNAINDEIGERGRDFAVGKRREVWTESGRVVVDQSKVWRLGPHGTAGWCDIWLGNAVNNQMNKRGRCLP